MITKLTLTSLAASTLFALTPMAMAHDEGDAHDAAHDALNYQHQEIHDLVNQGLISPREHERLDARLEAEHRAFHENLNGGSYGNYGYPQGYYGGSFNSGYNYPRGYYNNDDYSNGFRGNRWNHPAEHRQLRLAHRDIHRLVREGIISPQEHANLDAQLRDEHARWHSDYDQDQSGNRGISRWMNSWFNFR